ncbi:MAG: hypothetical protein ACO3QC_02530 [Phycisphaerales bacterium]
MSEQHADATAAAQSAAAPMQDPYAPYPDDRAERRRTWPLVFGMVSLVVGIFGTIMQGFGLVLMLKPGLLMSLAGLDGISPAPREIMIAGSVQAGLLVVLGVILTAGAVMLVLRKPLGATLIRIWAVARLVMVLAGLVLGVQLLQPQVSWQVDMNGEIREALRKRGAAESDMPPIATREEVERQAVRGLVMASFAFASWPFAMAFVLSRKFVKDDIEAWRAARSV